MGSPASWYGLPLLFGVGLVAACAKSGVPAQTTLDAISDKCGLSRDALKVKDGQVIFWPAEKTDFKIVDCALNELKNVPGAIDKMGFVGNERYGNFDEAIEPEADNAQKN